MKFQFLGCWGAPKTTDNLGYVWTVGEPIDVSDPDKIERLLNHPHFAKVDVSRETETLENIEQVASDVDDEQPLNAFDLPSDSVPVDGAPVRRRGRKPGSKNKPKETVNGGQDDSAAL